MKHPKLKIGYSTMSDGHLQEHGLAVVTAMKSNAHFPEPLPVLATLTSAVSAYSEALSLAKSRDKVKVAIKNSLRDELITALRKTADYCGYIAAGDRALLASTGLMLNAETDSPRTLANPENFSVQPGNNSGEVIVSVKRVASALAYILYYAPATDKPAWDHVTGSLPYFTITGLEPLKMYSFKMAVIGRKGQSTQTGIISKGLI